MLGCLINVLNNGNGDRLRPALIQYDLGAAILCISFLVMLKEMKEKK